MKKKFDAVKFQWKAREELGKKYLSDRERLLREIRQRYGRLQKQKVDIR